MFLQYCVNIVIQLLVALLAGQYVFWHSSAHILGEAMEANYGGHLCYGPPIDEGFYYDMWSEKYVALTTLYRTVVVALCLAERKHHWFLH